MLHLSSYRQQDALKEAISESHGLQFSTITLHRDMIGFVYMLDAVNGSRYVCKLYRQEHLAQAVQAAEIMHYLAQQEYPVAAIIPTNTGQLFTHLATPQGTTIAVLYRFVVGSEPDFSAEITVLGKQIGWLHSLMDAWPQKLISRDKAFYCDRYIHMLRQRDYDASKIAALDDYATQLWHTMSCATRGFCHGDLHSGNMFLTAHGCYVLYDFDAAAQSHPIIDVSTLSNCSDFNRLSPTMYDATMHRFEQFYAGYSHHRTLTTTDIQAMLAFVAIRHYELIATIASCQGHQELSVSFLDQQFNWLMQWQKLCEQKGSVA
jgi:Ser/Thr protein kinase RdoA (MazF antagonist)